MWVLGNVWVQVDGSSSLTSRWPRMDTLRRAVNDRLEGVRMKNDGQRASAGKRPTLPGEVEGHGGLLAAAALAARGVDTLFTLSGGHLFTLYDGCRDLGIRLIDVRHEQTAVFAAEGWAKACRKPGVAALTAGPGVTNGISAIASAAFTGSPVVVLGGRAPAARWGHGSLQELDHVPIVESLCKSATTCTSTQEVASAVDRALVSSMSPHRGPSFLDLPLDVAVGPGSADVQRPKAIETLEPARGDLERVAKLLTDSERPVLMAGADVYWEGAEEELRALAEAAGAPVFTNGLGRGCLAADHPLCFSRARSVAFKQADLVIVIGTPLDFRLGFGKFGDAAVVHLVDHPDRVAGHVDLAASAGGDLRAVLATLVGMQGRGASGRESWLSTLRTAEEERRAGEREMLESDQMPIHPGRIYGELAQRLDRDAIVIGDGGDYVSYAGKLLDTYTPGCFLDPGPYGCLGTGPGYALGAQLAYPDRQVVLLLGDGAAGFSIGDFDTLARFGLPVVIVVGNNSCWGLEKHPMQQIFGYHVAAELAPGTRYDEVMTALGGEGELVEDPAGIGPALERALAHRSGPYLINVLTDPENVYPRSSNLA